MTLVIGALTIGLILSVLALGIYISFRIFDFPDITAEKGAGLGIANVRQRLQMIYPGLHQLNIETDENKYRINLTIVI